MRKKWMSAILGGLLLFSSAAAQAKTELPVDIGGAKAICLVEAQSGAALMEYEADTAMETAGLVRLPALLVACEEADRAALQKDTTICVSADAAAVQGPTAFLSSGENIKAESLFQSAIMITAGDALFALTESITPSEAAFVAAVNQRLGELGVSIRYDNRMGQGAKASAKDLALLGAALVKSPTFLNYSGLYYEKLTHESGLITEMASSNKLLKTCAGANGVATGSSNEALYCGVFSAQRNGSTFVCSVIGVENAAQRAKIAKALLEYAFAGYEVKQLANKGEVLFTKIPVLGGTAADCDLVAAQSSCVVLPKADGAYTQQQDVPESLTAPVRAGEVLGKIVYLDADGNILARIDLTVNESIEKAAWKDYLYQIICGFLHQ